MHECPTPPPALGTTSHWNSDQNAPITADHCDANGEA